MIFRDRLGDIGDFAVEGLASESFGDMTDMLGTSMTVTLEAVSGYTRYFNGIVIRAEALGQVFVDDVRFHLYRFGIASAFQLLEQSSCSRIFKGLSVPDIVAKVCRDQGLRDIELRLMSSYPVRDYCVQYRESHLHFIQRIMEESGIYFHTEHHQDRHVLVLSDAPDSHRAASGFERMSFVPDALWGKRTGLSVKGWATARMLSSGAVSLGDYDYLHPRTLLSASEGAGAPGQGAGEIQDFPARGDGFGLDPSEIRKQALVRWEALNAERMTSHGETDAVGMSVGQRFALDDHPSPDANREYLVTGTTIRLCGTTYRSESNSERQLEPPFSCTFTAIPVTHAFRSPLVTPRPVIAGVQTAVVCGSKKDDDVVVDEHGRVSVAFFWEVSGTSEATSCPVRVASMWAGNRWGAISLPRVGQEVVVCFLEGNPDRPLIIGSVFNQDHMPPYALPDAKTRSGVVSRSVGGGPGDANEIRFEDRKGKEELFLHAQRDLREEAENDRFVSTERDAKETTGRDLVVEVDRDRKQDIGRDDTLKVGRKLRIQAMDQIELSVGPARLVMKKTGEIQITGTMVKINGMASAELSGGGTLAMKAGAAMSLVAGATVSMTGGAAVAVSAVRDAARDMALDAEDIALVERMVSPPEAIRALLEASRFIAALRLQMRLMPRGYVVPWVCQCANDMRLSASDREGVAMAEAWLRTRDEAHRRAAMAHAEHARYTGVGALAAASAGWSSGVLVDTKGQTVAEVGEHMMAVAAAGALLSLAATTDDMPGVCRQDSPLMLRVVVTPDDAIGMCDRFEVRNREVTLGRAPHCDWVLPGSAVSRLHAIVRRLNGRYLIEDRSTNGTWLNGDRLAHGEPQPLHDGDRIRIDAFDMVVGEPEAPPAWSGPPAYRGPRNVMTDLIDAPRVPDGPRDALWTMDRSPSSPGESASARRDIDEKRVRAAFDAFLASFDPERFAMEVGRRERYGFKGDGGAWGRPQHLQQQDRHMEHHVELRCAVLRPWSWGFEELELEYELLSIGKLGIRRARGVFPDGTPFSMPDRDPLPQPVSLDDSTRDITVFLALPLRSIHRSDVDWGQGEGEAMGRYLSSDIEVRDISGSVDETASITVGGLRTRLVVDREPRDGLTELPLARVSECRVDGSVRLAENFIPSVLSCHASRRLSILVKELLGLVVQRGDLLAARCVATASGASAFTDLALLQAINRWQPGLVHMAETLREHPEALYRFMLGMAGELATFVSPGRRCDPLPSYRHTTLQESFDPLMGVIRSGLDTLIEQTAIDVPLRSRDNGIWIGALHDALRMQATSFVLAARSPHAAAELAQRLPAQSKMGPADRILDLVNLQLPGIGIGVLDDVPRGVPFLPGWQYFTLDMASPFWSAIGVSRVLALHAGNGLEGLECRMWGLKA
ncbi:hypothetical protein KCV01_g8616, partial [Aureobasidium melanogenum]